MRRLGILAVLLMLLGACGDSATETVANDEDDRSEVVGDTDEVDAAKDRTTTTAKKAERQNVEIVSKGFTGYKPQYSDAPQASYGVVVRNPNADWIAASIDLNITFKNAGGQVVKTENDSITLIPPGGTVGVGGNAYEVADPATMDVQLLVGEWEEKGDAQFGEFTVDGVSTSEQQYGGLKTNATVHSTYSKDMQDVQAVAIYYDAAGAVIGGDFTFVDFVPAGGSIGVEITTSAEIPAPARTDVFVEITNLSLFALDE